MREEIIVNQLHSGRRLDAFLACRIAGLSRTRAQKLITGGAVEVNGVTGGDKNYRLCPGDLVCVVIPEPEPLTLQPEAIPLNIIYEDGDLLVIDKPRGMVVHPAPGNRSGTLVNALLHHCDDLSGIGGVIRPGIVHRLDKDTTGLLLVAKNDFTHKALAGQLKTRRLRREYLALAHGRVSPAAGRIKAPIGRHPRHRQRMAVVPNGREALTRYRVLVSIGPYTLLQVNLDTGRTHQIRVHLSFIGHPVAGDPIYAPAGLRDFPEDICLGQALHARRIAFIHPRNGRPLEFAAPLPTDFRQLLRLLREKYFPVK